MSDEIKAFKLVTGEEVIARITGEDSTDFTVFKPRVVAIMPGQNGQMGVTLIPLFACNQDGSALLHKTSIVSETLEINKELENGYVQQTTGIALV